MCPLFRFLRSPLSFSRHGFLRPPLFYGVFRLSTASSRVLPRYHPSNSLAYSAFPRPPPSFFVLLRPPSPRSGIIRHSSVILHPFPKFAGLLLPNPASSGFLRLSPSLSSLHRPFQVLSVFLRPPPTLFVLIICPPPVSSILLRPPLPILLQPHSAFYGLLQSPPISPFLIQPPLSSCVLRPSPASSVFLHPLLVSRFHPYSDPTSSLPFSGLLRFSPTSSVLLRLPPVTYGLIRPPVSSALLWPHQTLAASPGLIRPYQASSIFLQSSLVF